MTGKQKILIIDDDPHMCQSLKELLTSRNYELQTVNSAKRTLYILEKRIFDLVLLDIVLPDMDGYQLMDHIGCQSPDTLIIVITGYPSEESAIKALKRGAYDYIRKPFEPDKLLKIVKNTLNHQKAKRDKKLAEKALQESKLFLDNVLDSIQDGVSVLDEDLSIVLVNQTMRTWYAHMLPLEGKKCYEAYQGRSKTCEICPAIRALNTRKLEMDLVPLKETGEVKGTLELFAFPMLDSDGKLKGVVEYVRDVTDHKKAQTAFRESEKRFGELTELLPETIYEMDARGNLTFVNRSAFDQFFYDQQDFDQGLNAFEMIFPADRNRAVENVKKILRGEKAGLQEYTALRKDGSTFPALFHSTAILRNQKPVGLRGFIIDITEKKRLENQFQHAQRMESLGTLAGGVAHDFNNLLMGIQGHTSLLLMGKNPPHPDFNHLKSIEDCVENAADLTKQLLGFARGGKYEVKPININELIKRHNRIFGRTKKDITIRGKYEKDLRAVEVDQGQIQQLLLNLYINAWQAMPGGGELYIQTENITIDANHNEAYQLEPGKYVKVSVTDTGVGMDEATQQRIFDPFFTTKEIGRGTGLGLASVYGIVKNHGGFINVYSKTGKGTTFNIYMPASEKEIIEENKTEKEVSQGFETVLLVDDEEVIIDVGKSMLEKLGYKVLIARNGSEAIDIYGNTPDNINIVILDMIMPGMGGGNIYDELKKIDPDIKALLSSGYSMNGQATAILERGCNGFIHKPFSISELSTKIRDILEKY